MKKDTLYIDVEDDITAIIEKVKSSSEKIIALVPPKRAGVLQSAVNLKLLQRAANAQDKHLVLITHDHSLASLAAGASIPVAKTLQSRPELAKNNAPDTTSEEIINGDELPIGELATTAPKTAAVSDDEIILPPSVTENGTPDKKTNTSKSISKSLKNSKNNIPNFNSFRKKMFLGIGVALLLIIFLFWANVIAPHATVKIIAKTTNIDLQVPITLKTDTPTSPQQSHIQPVVQQIKKTNTIDFVATGKKQVGEKASGTMTIMRDGVSADADVIPSGTGFSSGNYTFVTTSSVTVPASRIVGRGIDYGQASASVIAAAVGEEYNLSAREYQPTISGFTASGSQMSGGTKREITVISDTDVSNAQKQIAAQDQNAIKNELTKKFDTKNVTIIPESFTPTSGDPSVNPAVGSEATKAQLTSETTFSMYALKKSDISAVLNIVMAAKLKTLKEKNQQIYENGAKKIKITKYDPNGAATLQGTGYTGPKIDKEALKKQIVGKNYEEIRQLIRQTDGVDDVNTVFSPFWVSTAPEAKKIDIVFNVSQ
jgi:hypothetical protein